MHEIEMTQLTDLPYYLTFLLPSSLYRIRDGNPFDRSLNPTCTLPGTKSFVESGKLLPHGTWFVWRKKKPCRLQVSRSTGIISSVNTSGEMMGRALDEDSRWYRYSGERARKQQHQQGINVGTTRRSFNF